MTANRNTLRRRSFTLIEMMVAMFLASMMSYMLIRSLVVAQQAWDMSDSIARIYENSRVAFDLLEHDVHSIVTSSVDGAEIGVRIGDPDPTNSNRGLQFCIVSSTDPSQNARSRLCEISYSHHADASAPSTATKPFVLYRQQVSEDSSANWNFLGMPSNWYDNGNSPDRFETVIRGVFSFEVRFYDSNENLLAPGTDTFIRPNKAVVDMILFDEKLTTADDSKKHKTKRAFTKVLYLNHVIQ